MENEREWKSSGVCVAALVWELCLSSAAAIGADRVASAASCVELMNEDIRWADEIVLRPMDASTMPIATAAIERWERCEEYSIAFPRFVVGAGQGRIVKIVIDGGLPGPGYCGSFVGETITI